MRKKIVLSLLMAFVGLSMEAQTTVKKVYDEEINPVEQIDMALAKAKAEGRYVVCQVGGNWCPWCLRFCRFHHQRHDHQ